MGKTKTAFVGSTEEDKVKSGEEKYKERQKKKAEEEAKKKAAIEGIGLKGGERVKVISGNEPVIEEEKKEEEKLSKGPKVRGKNYKSARGKIDREKLYPIDEAIKIVKESSFTKFDSTIELHIVVKKLDIQTRITLPFSFGKSKKVEIADENTIKKLSTGKIDFDLLLATPDMMPKLVPFARLLGPKGMMPNPKNGTIIKDKSDKSALELANKVILKTQKDQTVIHTTIGKQSQKDEEIIANIKTVIDGLGGTKQIEKVYLKSTMSPSVKIRFN